MRIQVASDLHLEFFERQFPDFRAVQATGADVLVLAGDIHRQTKALDVFRDWPIPVLLLHGNHEFYRSVAEETLAEFRSNSTTGSVRHLERTVVFIGDVRILGCCLWTDYAFDGDAEGAMAHAEAVMMDHRMIRTRNGPFMAAHALEMHREARAWLSAELSKPHAGRTVVCTHHAPHPKSIHEKFATDPGNPAFVSDLTVLMQNVDLWVHGHMHTSFDYRVGRTRVVANPRGYALNRREAVTPEDIVWENPKFDPRLIVEV